MQNIEIACYLAGGGATVSFATAAVASCVVMVRFPVTVFRANSPKRTSVTGLFGLSGGLFEIRTQWVPLSIDENKKDSDGENYGQLQLDLLRNLNARDVTITIVDCNLFHTAGAGNPVINISTFLQRGGTRKPVSVEFTAYGSSGTWICGGSPSINPNFIQLPVKNPNSFALNKAFTDSMYDGGW